MRLPGWIVVAKVAALLTLAPGPARAHHCVERAPISLLLALDVSTSMLERVGSTNRLELARAFAIEVVSRLDGTGFLAESAVFTFCGHVNAVSPWAPASRTLRDLSGPIGTCGATAVFRAIVTGASHVGARDAAHLRLLLLMTDGQDTTGDSPSGAVTALSLAGIRSRLVAIDTGHEQLGGIAAFATPAGHHQALGVSARELELLVGQIEAATCMNYGPHAAVTLSQTDLELGRTGFEITFDGSGSTDLDHGPSGLRYDWTLTHLGSGLDVTGTGTRFTHVFDDALLPAGIDWVARLRVTDGRGASDEVTRPFIVRGVPPQIAFAGGGTIDALQPMQVATTVLEDIDGGGPLRLDWSLEGAPAGAALRPGERWPRTDRVPAPPLLTSGRDVTVLSDGTRRLCGGSPCSPWVFRLRAEDNEGEVAEEEAVVEVRNLPPELRLVPTSEEIDVGQSVTYRTEITADRDGGELRFEWRIVQRPISSLRRLGATAVTGPSFHFAAGPDDAGTWIFRITAWDDEGESATETRTLLVDAPPVAIIRGDRRIGSLTDPLRLDGSESVDPDSPCPDEAPNFCHENEEGPVLLRSSERLRYSWTLVDVPLEWITEYYPGGVEDALGAAQGRPELSLPPRTLKPGRWLFQLEVTDGEGNTDYTTQSVEVYEQGSAPIALVPPFIRYDLAGPDLTLEDVRVDGSLSFDPEEVLGTGSYYPGIGIQHFDWTHFWAPADCPLLGLGLGGDRRQSSAVLYGANSVVPPACHGLHMVQLTVTDFDRPAPRSASAISAVRIGNCAEWICIEAPLTDAPYHVEVAADTDVLIRYRLDSALSDDVFFVPGLFVKLIIYQEFGSGEVVYEATDHSVLASDRGGELVFHWDGRTKDRALPADGLYGIRLVLLDHALANTAHEAVEPASLHIATARVKLHPETERWIIRDRLTDLERPEPYQIRYSVAGLARPEELVFRLFEASGALVYTSAPYSISGATGDVYWDGGLASGAVVQPGSYELELEVRRGGAALDISPRYPLTVLRLDIDVDTDRDGRIADDADEAGEHLWSQARGAIFSVNLDADGGRYVGPLALPDALHIDDDGEPVFEDLEIDGPTDSPDITPFVIRGLGATPPTDLRFFLVLGSQEDAQSVHVFKRIDAGERAILGELGDRALGGTPAIRELDITLFMDVASPDFLGVMGDPSSDMTLGLEGMFFRNTGARNSFDGEIELRLEARAVGPTAPRVVYADTVRMKVAPWIMLPTERPSVEVWAADFGAANADFRNTPAGAAPGHVGLSASGHLRVVAPSASSPQLVGSQWFQDHVETGYTQRPGGPLTWMTLRNPYGAQPEWPQQRLLRSDAGLFQLGGDLGADAGSTVLGPISGGFGGNLELLPPAPAYPRGRIVVGDTVPDAFWEFLVSQEVQPPFRVPLRWLSVGHVDEAFGFTGRGTDTIIADPSLAYSLLSAIPAAARGRTVLFTRSGSTREGVVSAASAPARLETGVNLTGSAWRFVRVFHGTAAGQVARVTPRNGWLEVHEVWDTTSRLIDPLGGAGSIHDQMVTAGGSSVLDSGGQPHRQSTWFRNPSSGDRYVLIEDTRFWLNRRLAAAAATPIPAVVTVAELLADANLRQLNTHLAQRKLEEVREAIRRAAGQPVTFHPVPVLYFGRLDDFDDGRKAFALTPNLANFQEVNGALYFPRQFGATDAAGRDIFEEYVRARFPTARFVDDWDLYHRLEGEVHCGSTTLRALPLADWWSP